MNEPIKCFLLLLDSIVISCKMFDVVVQYIYYEKICFFVHRFVGGNAPRLLRQKFRKDPRYRHSSVYNDHADADFYRTARYLRAVPRYIYSYRHSEKFAFHDTRSRSRYCRFSACNGYGDRCSGGKRSECFCA